MSVWSFCLYYPVFSALFLFPLSPRLCLLSTYFVFVSVLCWWSFAFVCSCLSLYPCFSPFLCVCMCWGIRLFFRLSLALCLSLSLSVASQFFPSHAFNATEARDGILQTLPFRLFSSSLTFSSSLLPPSLLSSSLLRIFLSFRYRLGQLMIGHHANRASRFARAARVVVSSPLYPSRYRLMCYGERREREREGEKKKRSDKQTDRQRDRSGKGRAERDKGILSTRQIAQKSVA